MILHLSSLNDNIKKKHFKMTHLDTAVALMLRDCFLGSIDLKDAFYSVLIQQEARKFLCLSWKGQLYQFNAMPFGLTSTFQLAPMCSILTLHWQGDKQVHQSFVTKS